MLEPEDRRKVEELNGMSSSYANYRVGETPDKSIYKKAPTRIQIPSNSLPHRPETMGHASGSNPFTGSLRKSTAKAGNPTSSRTLVNASTHNEGPVRKKIKYDYTFSLNKSPRSGREASNTNSKLNSQSRDAIIIQDDEVEYDPTRMHKSPTSQSSDELNVFRSHDIEALNDPPGNRSPKYPFPPIKNVAGGTAGHYDLVPDGQNTQWVAKTYTNAEDAGSDLPDPIESDDTIHQGQSRVQQIVANIERRGIPPKIDLANSVSRKVGKAKGMKPKKFSPKINSQATPKSADRTEIPMKRKIQDHIATSSSLLRPGEQGPITLQEVIIDQNVYTTSGNHTLEAFFSPDYIVRIKNDEKEIFNLQSWPREFCDVVYTDEFKTPAIQIKLQSVDSPRLFTMHADTKNKREADIHQKLVKKLKDLYQAQLARNSLSLMQFARNNAGNELEEKAALTSNNASKYPKEKVSKPPDGQKYSPSLRYTPDEGMNMHPPESISMSNPTPRVSALRRSIRNAPPPKPVDQDKVILVYPQGIPGAVNITNGDLARLQPGEYLNDTLIEFGLKLWLKELEAKQPGLASQVHIFNSFFYKKLNNKRNDAAAFETVRKWTAKFDIFQKKYIIVPINEHMHWYLAIIYEPEHVLTAMTPDEPSPRKKTRLSVKVDTTEGTPSTASGSASAACATDTVLHSAKSITSSEAEVERNLDAEFQSSCTIDPLSADQVDQIENDASSDLSYVSDPEDLIPFSERRQHEAEYQEASASVSRDEGMISDVIDVDMSEGRNQDSTTASVKSTGSTTASTPEIQENSLLTAIPSASFYQSANSIGKQKADPRAIPINMDIDESTDIVVKQPLRKTYIFTFDSLGTNHPHAIKRLGQYLRMEAKDKKGVANAGLAGGKTALVPVQPNFCDCGVYLLHFAQTFLSNPSKYYRLIMSQSKNMSNEQKQEQWHDKKVADMRQELSLQILQLSDKWQKERALKEKEEASDGKVVNSIDSDSDIEMPSPVKRNGRAARIRG